MTQSIVLGRLTTTSTLLLRVRIHSETTKAREKQYLSTIVKNEWVLSSQHPGLTHHLFLKCSQVLISVNIFHWNFQTGLSKKAKSIHSFQSTESSMEAFYCIVIFEPRLQNCLCILCTYRSTNSYVRRSLRRQPQQMYIASAAYHSCMQQVLSCL